MEGNQLNGQVGSAARVGVAALLVGMVAMGCAGHDGGATGGSPSSTPAAQATRTDSAATVTPRQAETAIDVTPLPADAGPADASPSVGTTGVPPATADPLDSSLSNLDQLLNGIDNSISNSDAGATGGE
jgi:hypothetical protein